VKTSSQSLPRRRGVKLLIYNRILPFSLREKGAGGMRQKFGRRLQLGGDQKNPRSEMIDQGCSSII
jgi:hypothetical protein